MVRPAAVAPELRVRLGRVAEAARECRHLWRWHWVNFWMLRWENTLRRPAWRVEEERRAWRRMRDEVRVYAGLRRQMAALSAELRAIATHAERAGACTDSEFINKN